MSKVTRSSRMSSEKITAESRTEFGKGAARRIRRADKVPAVIYGHGNDPQHISLPGHDTMMALKHGGTNTPDFIEVSVEDAEVGFHVLAKDLELPSGSLLLTDDEALVVNVVHAPTAEEIEAELEEAEAEVGIEHEVSDEEAAEAEAEG